VGVPGRVDPGGQEGVVPASPDGIRTASEKEPSAPAITSPSTIGLE